jgi:hypothetical protein
VQQGEERGETGLECGGGKEGRKVLCKENMEEIEERKEGKCYVKRIRKKLKKGSKESVM